MKRPIRRKTLFAALSMAAGLVLCAAARGDELHLKDGSKVVGTIVGYQGTAFRVKTSYGFALVERSAVVSITMDNAEAKPAPAEKTPPEAPEKNAEAASATHEHEPDAEAKTSAHSVAAASVKTASPALPARDAKAAPPQTNAAAEALPNSAPTAKTPEAGKPAPAAVAKIPNAAPPAAANAKPSAPVPATNTQAAPAVPVAAPANAVPAPPTEADPGPVPVREEVQDNLYINETYGFRIYKPPDWDLIEGARAELPGAVAALGTADQTTYLIIGQEASADTLDAHVTATNDRLSDLFEDFRPGALRNTLIAGLPACEYQFHGVANNQPWFGTVALISRGGNILTIFGVTAANSDLVQIQQNVIARAIASLQFSKP